MDDPREWVRLAFLVFFVLGTLVVGAIYWVRGKLGLTGADLLSLFGEQPLCEVDALFELDHLLPMPMLHLRHPIVETIDRRRIGPTGPQSFHPVAVKDRDGRGTDDQSADHGRHGRRRLLPRAADACQERPDREPIAD